MSNKKIQLQIKQLTAGGQLLNCVNCFSGQVSVFRAAVPSAVRPYMNAFAGISGAERFVLEIEHEPYVPYNNNLIGFGERFVPQDGNTTDYLIRNHIPQNQINSILVSYGLENCKNTPCIEITRCEERRLRIITAVYSNDKILVINDPFDLISSDWRERFAELLVNFARTKSQIVVVPSLSYRPECWIDNEFIARIQVGENIQKTIGFSSQATNIQAMINQIREEHGGVTSADSSASSAQSSIIGKSTAKQSSENLTKKTPSANIQANSQIITEPQQLNTENKSLVDYDWEEESKTTTTKNPDFINLSVNWYRTHLNKIAATAIAFVMLYIFTSFQQNSHPRRIASPVVSDHVPRVSPKELNSEPVNVVGEITNAVNNIVASPPSEAEIQHAPKQAPQQVALFMRYPDNIRDSIMNAVNGNGVRNKNPEKPLNPEKHANKKNEVASDFLKLLATTGSDKDDDSHSDGGYNNDSPQQSYNNREEFSPGHEDEQARREQIRQKFLEAIQRAQERSQ